MAVGEIDAAVDALKQAARLENDPVDVIGGLADLLGTVGRTDEALYYWALLVAKHPELADAHLNRAVTAANAGKFDLALEASEAGLRRFPGHARLLSLKALALSNSGRANESIGVFEQAVAAEPGRALTRHNQGMALRTAHRFAEACDAFGAASKLGLRGGQFHANWAAAALGAGETGDAVKLYETALAEEPGHQESLKALTSIKFEFGDPANAFGHFEQSLHDRQGSVEAWVDWIGELIANYRYEEAAEIGRRAVAAHRAVPGLAFLAALAAGMSGDAAQALRDLDGLPDSLLQSDACLLGRAQLALRAGDPALAAKLAEEATRRNPVSQLGWALLGLAWRLLDDPHEQWLCDYERLVMVMDVPPPSGDSGPAQFAASVAVTLDSLHQGGAAPGNQSLRNGTQTRGHLFNRPEPEVQQLRAAVTLAARNAIASLPDDPTHPFLSRKSANLAFAGSWSARLQGGDGRHVPHFHLGWMSSAYYARLPASDAGPDHQGWIEFGTSPSRFNLALPPRHMVEPVAGRLVLFPSYLWHSTVPFAAGSRLTAAFDLLPLRPDGRTL